MSPYTLTLPNGFGEWVAAVGATIQVEGGQRGGHNVQMYIFIELTWIRGCIQMLCYALALLAQFHNFESMGGCSEGAFIQLG